MPVVIQQIVRQFELIERNDLLHPLRPFGRGVRVVMDSPGGGGVGFASHQPGGAVEGVPAGGRGTLSHGPGGSRPRPCSAAPNDCNTRAPQNPARAGPPGPPRGKHRLSIAPSSHERNELSSAARIAAEGIYYFITSAMELS